MVLQREALSTLKIPADVKPESQPSSKQLNIYKTTFFFLLLLTSISYYQKIVVRCLKMGGAVNKITNQEWDDLAITMGKAVLLWQETQQNKPGKGWGWK